jgi:hypothetical protein
LGGALGATVAAGQAFNGTGSWDTWADQGFTATFNAGTNATQFDAMGVTQALADTSYQANARALRAEIAAMTFKPTLAAGVATTILPRLTAMADVRMQLGEGMRLGDRSHVGLGAELRMFPFVPLRAGAAVIDGGYVLSAGAGVEIGVLRLNAGFAQKKTEYGASPTAAVTVSFGQ